MFFSLLRLFLCFMTFFTFFDKSLIVKIFRCGIQELYHLLKLLCKPADNYGKILISQKGLHVRRNVEEIQATQAQVTRAVQRYVGEQPIMRRMRKPSQYLFPTCEFSGVYLLRTLFFKGKHLLSWYSNTKK